MHYLFEPAQLQKKALLWGHRSISAEDFPGFYHWHQCSEILIVHEGIGSVIVNQKTCEIRRGMLFFFQPFQLHKVNANVSPEQPYIRSNLHLDLYDFEEKLRPFPILHARLLYLWQGNHQIQAFDIAESFDYAEQAFAMFARNMTATRPVRDSDYEHSLLLIMQLLNALTPHFHSVQSHPSERMSPRPLAYAEKVMQWVEEHYNEQIKLDDIADAMHLSKYYLSRLFQNETGSSIPDYITARRIKSACRLLQTTAYSIERIGSEVGIPNPSYFIRTFKKSLGMTPLQYRKRY